MAVRLTAKVLSGRKDLQKSRTAPFTPGSFRIAGKIESILLNSSGLTGSRQLVAQTWKTIIVQNMCSFDGAMENAQI